MTDSKAPDSRTVIPGQPVTYHQTESRLGVRMAWARQDSEARALYEKTQREQEAATSPGTTAWRNAALRSVLLEQNIVGRAHLSETEFDRLIDGLMRRLDGPVLGDEAARIESLERQVAELRGNRDAHAKAIVELRQGHDSNERSIVCIQLDLEALCKHEPIGRLLCEQRGYVEPDDDEVVVAPEVTPPMPDESWRDLPPHIVEPHPRDAICSRCGAALMFSARARGDGLCGPCHRKAAGAQTPADCTTAELHADEAHPDYEYTTTGVPRKAWDAKASQPWVESGEPSWERNIHRGRDGWERFDAHEEAYWMRRKAIAPSCARCRRPFGEGIESGVPARDSDGIWSGLAHNRCLTWGETLAGLAHLDAQSRRTTEAASSRGLQPGDIWRDHEGAEYDVVRAAEVGGRPRWWIDADRSGSGISLQTKDELHTYDDPGPKGRPAFALVLHNPEAA